MEQKIFGVIYKIANLVNGKVYIGQTTQGLERRWKKHMNAASLGKIKSGVCGAIRKYGVDNFIIEIVATATDRNELNLLEKFYIKEYNTKNSKIGYNQTNGGEGMSGYYHSEETKQKMSLSKKDRPLSEGHKRKIGQSNKNKPKSEEHKLNMSLVKKNKSKSEEHKQKLKDSSFKLSVLQKSHHGVIIAVYPSIRAAWLATGVHENHIGQACKGKAKSAGGFLWSYNNPTQHKVDII